MLIGHIDDTSSSKDMSKIEVRRPLGVNGSDISINSEPTLFEEITLTSGHSGEDNGEHTTPPSG